MGVDGELTQSQIGQLESIDRIDWPDAQAKLAQGAVLVTANQRQAQALLLRYARAQTKAAWPKPAIVAWPQWLRQVFAEYNLKHNTPNRLLDDAQCDWLWQQIIDQDRSSDGLLNRAACAQAANSAWDLVQDFAVTERELQSYPSAETDAFIRWANQYATQLENSQLIDNKQLARWLNTCLQDQSWQPPETLLTYGFERWLPAQRNLLESIQAAGSELNELALPSRAQQLRVVATIDAEQELLHAAQWARQLLTDHADNEQMSVAIAVPDLHHRRAQVDTVLTHALHPQWDGLKESNLDEPNLDAYKWFDISDAAMLDEQPLVRLVFQWLTLLQGDAPFAVFSSLLRSPWLDADECMARSRLEVHLRSLGLARFSVAEVMQLAGLSEAAWHAPTLQAHLRIVMEARALFRQRQPASVWVERVSELLDQLQWPLADSANDSHDHSLRQRWQELLQQFRKLSPSNEQLPGSAVLSWLQRLARRVPVQHRRPHARVQVLGLLEALGQRFDAIWVTGLTASSWPAAPRPDPLLPVALQRRHQMPNSNAEQELRYARHATATLQASAAQAVFSYAKTDQDADQQASPLIRDLASIEELPAIHAQPMWQQMWQQRQLENYVDQQAPALMDLSDDVAVSAGVTHGGSGVLKAQAQCPFQAVAAYRLKAEALTPIQPGISALQHGNCVHAVMQAFWQDFNPQQLPDQNARAAHLTVCIERVLSQNTIPCLRQIRLRESYSEYLHTNLGRWLAIEAERSTDFTTQSLEQAKQLQLGPLRLHVRMDRVDQLADGSHLVLDYKSGIGNPKQWADERLSEPQLPLYALHTPDIGGVVFANLHPQKAGFSGFTLQPGQLPGVPVLGQGRGDLHNLADDWISLREFWQARLVKLADGYFSGQAQADPLNNVCQYCRRYSLCRIASLDAPEQVDGQIDSQTDSRVFGHD